MRIAVTGFEPFGGESVNASGELLGLLEEDWDESRGELTTRVLPVSFDGAAAALREFIAAESPDLLVCLGEAGGRAALTPERFAHVIAEARIPDNDGAQPRGLLLDDGPERLATSAPLEPVIEAMRAVGVAGEISEDAGRFVCNSTYRAALRQMPGAVFIHVPAIRPDGARPAVGTETDDTPAARPSMSLADAARGLIAALEALIGQ